MATVTPNFLWPVPQSTDLVKDGATAIEALGDSIDASLVDLKGGTTGQVLSKTSGTDMDFTWVTTDDANAIQNSIVDAKGDLIAATANDTPARLAVGTNYYVLAAQSAETTGLKWTGAVTAYTPTWGSYGTAPSIGNGQMAGYWQRYGNLCHVRFFFQAGSTTTFGTNIYYWTLPFTAANTNNEGIPGAYYLEDFAVAGYRGLVSLFDGGSFGLTVQSTNAAVSGTNPFTMGTNDLIRAEFSYEVA
jgi:hypothetical protein